MRNIVIGQFKHETNCFCDIPADMKAYRDKVCFIGDETFQFRSVKNETGAFLDVLGAEKDVNIVTSISLDASPSGPVTADVYNLFCEKLMAALDSVDHVDGVLLSLHGAMVSEAATDGEGTIFERVRAKVGPNVPVMASLDLHTNVTAKMIANATALCTYKNYPHTDTYEVGLRVATLMLRTLKGEITPEMAYCKLPYLMPLTPTATPMLRPFYEKEARFEALPGVLSVDIAHGFFHADFDECGTAVIAVTDGDKTKAQALASELGMDIWNARESIRVQSTDLDAALDEIAATPATGKPYVLCDMSDNPGGGGTCDTMFILRRILQRNVKNAAVVMIHDPEAVQKAVEAGVGNTVTLALGAKVQVSEGDSPMIVTGYVKAITDGLYRNKDHMAHGALVNMGRTVVLVVDDVEIVVCSVRTQPYDAEALRSVGITPTDKNVILVKSAIHFRQSYENFVRKIFNIVVPGVQYPSPEIFKFKSKAAQMWPMNPAATFTA